jgi:hypothetical protein
MFPFTSNGVLYWNCITEIKELKIYRHFHGFGLQPKTGLFVTSMISLGAVEHIVFLYCSFYDSCCNVKWAC